MLTTTTTDVDLFARSNTAENYFIILGQLSAAIQRWKRWRRSNWPTQCRIVGRGRTNRPGPRDPGHVRGEPVQAGQSHVSAGCKYFLFSSKRVAI